MDRPLRIIYLSHYYPPEVNAPALRVSEMSRRWVEQNAEVTVLTGFPNHPTGIIPEEYKGKTRQIENQMGIKVVRTWMYAAANKGFAKRILNYLSFMFSAIFLGSSRIRRPDIIIATSPQFFVAVAGYVISRLKGCRFVFEIRDLWPEEIVAVGAIKNRLIIRSLEAIEMFLYRKADLIVAVAQGTIDTLIQRGVPAAKMTLVPNGVNIDHFQTEIDATELRRKMNLEDKFIVSYIGTHGMAHRLDVILDAAKMVQSIDSIRFLFVGEGAEKKKLINKAREMSLSNVIFHDQIPRNQIPDFYKATDLFLVPLRKAELFTKNIPSKIYEIMAASRPMLISTEGESRRLVESAGAGVGAAPENAIEIADKIVQLHKDAAAREQMGRNGLAFVLANASRTRLADDYLRILRQVAAGKTVFKLTAESLLAQDNQQEKSIRVKATA